MLLIKQHSTNVIHFSEMFKSARTVQFKCDRRKICMQKYLLAIGIVQDFYTFVIFKLNYIKVKI